MIIDIKHPLRAKAKLYDAAGKPISTAFSYDTETRKAQCYVKGSDGKMARTQIKKTESSVEWKLDTEEIADVEIRFENVPIRFRHLIPSGCVHVLVPIGSEE